jgi:hypothetical protein
MASRIFDFPDPLRPVIALKWGSKLYCWAVIQLVSDVQGNVVEALSGKPNDRTNVPVDHSLMSVGLEAINNNLLNVHDARQD